MLFYEPNQRARQIGKPFSSGLTAEIAKDVRRFHRGMEGYRVTPLISLKQLANQLNVHDIVVKDESQVLDLDSFKVLGASYSIFKVLCKILNLNEKTATFSDLRKVPKGKYTFVAATDGNFGKAVAWMSHQLGQKAIVYVPQNMIMRRRVAIQDFGAVVREPDGEDKSYDGAVGSLAAYVGKDNYVVISDTAWKGFEDVPLNVMQGYLTLCDEATEQLASFGIEKPSHTFLQVGVGGFAASVIGYYCSLYGDSRPISISVEPNAAACFLESLKNDKLTKIKTEDTVMAGLNCGEPSTLAWPVLYNNADYFVSISDDAASLAVKTLASPVPQDQKIISGESGAAGLGALIHLMNTNQTLAKKMGIDKNSTILLFNTEGATGVN
jgi:diaminopropionate ammonia-lyase